MLSKNLAVFLIVAVFSAFTSASTMAMAPVTTTPDPQKDAPAAKPVPDLKLIIAERSREFERSSESFSPEKFSKKAWDDPEKEKRGTWTKKKTFWTVFLVAAATVGVVLLVKYSKKCLRYEPNCPTDPDYMCHCLEYAE